MKDKRFEDLTPKNTLENKNLRNDSVGQFKGLYFDDHTDSGDIILTEDSAFESTGYAFPELKKWWIMVVIGIVQYSMNLNTSIYSNAVSGITEEFGVRQLNSELLVSKQRAWDR
ncbi:hypothetical protein E3Q02_04199 [Wallemia mellicola]|uniref:Major facilitator superfamily (MFS) profile domain-containing protein n=1 Tax=Wallemia mellicola TaxID=1708541 RepID=A0AB38MR23_9BASI|nr:hypothetical protein E3Q02_04199 [Wallemia mellicola]